MSRSEPESVTTLGGDVVELTVPADSAYVAVVRTATAGLAARLSFSLDEIEDLRIAVDEACAMLLGLPAPDAPHQAVLTCRFDVLADGLRVTVSAPTKPKAALPVGHSFAWQVLTAHASEVNGRSGEGQATISMVKRRSGS
jgi:serine/threonine-protein kinase RsbW